MKARTSEHNQHKGLKAHDQLIRPPGGAIRALLRGRQLAEQEQILSPDAQWLAPTGPEWQRQRPPVEHMALETDTIALDATVRSGEILSGGQGECPRFDGVLAASAGKRLIDLWAASVSRAQGEWARAQLAAALRAADGAGIADLGVVVLEALPRQVKSAVGALEESATLSAVDAANLGKALDKLLGRYINRAVEAGHAYAEDHACEVVASYSETGGEAARRESDFFELWTRPPHSLPVFDGGAHAMNTKVRLSAALYQLQNRATCATGGSSPALCDREKLEDPDRWIEDAKKKEGASNDGRPNFAETRLGWH